jgi:hypothetical protein
MMRGYAVRALALVALLCLAAVAYAADVTYTSHLQGTPVEPRAEARAVWTEDVRKVTLSVEVAGIHTADGGSVYLGDTFVGYMAFRDGHGNLFLVNGLPRVQPGTAIKVTDPEHRDRVLLTGFFR